MDWDQMTNQSQDDSIPDRSVVELQGLIEAVSREDFEKTILELIEIEAQVNDHYELEMRLWTANRKKEKIPESEDDLSECGDFEINP